MQSVPFKVEVHGGLSEAHGAAYVEADVLVLEMQTTVLGLVKQAPRAFYIDLAHLERAEHRRGLFGDTLRLRTRPFALIADAPGVREGCLRLRVARKHRSLLDVLLRELELWTGA